MPSNRQPATGKRQPGTAYSTAPLTVAVATLDRPEALHHCLDALLHGEVLPAEVIVVDQGQSDGAARVIAAYAEAPLKVVHVRQERRGLSAARNAAIAEATCPIIAITDDDCLPRPDWIANLERDFSHSPTRPAGGPDAVTGRVLPLGPARPGLYSVSARESTSPALFHGRVIPWLVGTGGNCAVKRALLERVGGYDELLGVGTTGKAGEDADLIYRLLKAGARIQYDPDVVVYHERQSKERRQASRWSYGYGVGALCGTWLRRGDLYAFVMLAHWFRTQAWDLAGSLRRGQWWLAYTRLLSLGSVPPGLYYGLSRRWRA